MRLMIRRATPVPSQTHRAAGLSEIRVHRLTGSPSQCRTGSEMTRNSEKCGTTLYVQGCPEPEPVEQGRRSRAHLAGGPWSGRFLSQLRRLSLAA